MKHALKIELIGDSNDKRVKLYSMILDYSFGEGLSDVVIGKKPNRAWVAKICGISNKFGLDRFFLKGKVDYEKSNSTGSRGIYKWYLLESGFYYEICEPISWRKNSRYFAFVDDVSGIIKTTKEEVVAWAKSQSE